MILFFFLTANPAWAQLESMPTSDIPQQFEGFNLQGYTDGGQKAWDVKGTRADIEGNNIKIVDVDANRYGEQNVNLKAQKGSMDKVTGNIVLQKDVVITSERGTQLKTDTLNWEKEKDLVSTNDPVEITDKSMVANGTGLVARPGLGTAQMNKDVTVKVETENLQQNGGRVTITCDGPMEIDQKKNMAVFNENALAVQTDRTLKADKLEIHFNPQTQKIQQMICLGNVVIVQAGNSTHSDKAVYDADTQKMTLYGRPKLILVTEGQGGMASFKNMMKSDTEAKSEP